MKKALFLTVLVTSQLFAALDIINAIPLENMDDIHIEHTAASTLVQQEDKRPEKWVNELGNMQDKAETKKSYLRGILNGQQYGTSALPHLFASKSIKALYQHRGYETFWISSGFDVDPKLFEMLEVIKNADNEALDSSKYHWAEITTILDEMKNSVDLSTKEKNLLVAQVDILLSDAFLTMAKDLHEGAIDFDAFHHILVNKGEKEKINYKWDSPHRKMNYVSFLEKIKQSGGLKDKLFSLSTYNELFSTLKSAYMLYRNIALQGGWETIPRGKTLRMGTISKKRVPLLAKRLYLTGDLEIFDPEITVVTPEMKAALKHYQRRVGIWPSGVLNETTRRSLNIPVEKRVEKIKLNLERMRWENENFGDAYIWVNIPDFKVYFIRDGVKDIDMRVVVGKKSNPTPIFDAALSYIVLNPTWSVPHSIVAKEMLPRLQEDPDYLASRKFKMYKSWDKDRKEIDSFDIDWWQYDEESTVPYYFVREAGKGNPLGLVKFMFPNKYAVYMHDTPQKKLFQNSKRAYSHGCIRLAKPQKLLEFVSNNYTATPYKKVQSLQKSGKSQSLKLDYDIPVHIRYYTAWADDEGVHFGTDIYGYDKIQLKLLNK